MAKSALAKRRDETELQFRSRLARARQEARDRSEPIAPHEAQRHGDYQAGFVTHVETNTKAHTLVNRGGTALDRWRNSGKLSDSQENAIDLCISLWLVAGRNDRVTANYGERIPGTGNADLRNALEIDARKDLHRIMDYFPGPLRIYWGVFEDICRHGHRADVAGAQLSPSARSADTRAHQVVCFVADIIAMKEGL